MDDVRYYLVGLDANQVADLARNDGDRFNLGKVAAGVDNVTLYGELGELELGGVRIGMNHYPEIAKRLAESGAYQAVFSGHDHRKYVHAIGETTGANPGEIMGRFGEPSFGVFDTGTGGFEHVTIG